MAKATKTAKKENDVGTTNQKQVSSKQAKKNQEEAKKMAESKGWQSMAYKFSKPKAKK